MNMASPTTRRFVRLAAVSLVLAIVFGTGLVVQLRQHTNSAHAQVADPSRAQVILDWAAARNRSDNAATAALFADNTFYISAAPQSCTTQTPCYDRASVLQSLPNLAAALAGNACLTVTTIQVSGSIVTGRFEARNDAQRARGVERSVVAFMAEVRDGQIIAFVHRYDSADPQTALSTAIAAGTAQPGTPIPTPNSLCG
jgi:ketosteroid isomerase-like protein